MADKKISSLTDGGALQDTDYVVVARSGDNYKIAGSEFGGGSQNVLSTRVNLSSSDVLSLYTTAVELVAAPGADKYVLPLHCAIYYEYVTTPYTGTPTLSIGWPLVYADAQAELIADTAGFWDQTEDMFTIAVPYGSPVPYATSNVNNQPCQIQAFFENPTLGDGTLWVQLFYAVIDL